MLADSHCHLDRVDCAPFNGQLARVLEAAATQGVTHLLSVSVDLESWPALAAMTAPFPQVSLSVGVHPGADTARAPTVDELVAISRSDARVVALGETGLDYHYGRDRIAAQQAYFRTHIAAARILQKPLIVHTREARKDTLCILREEGADHVGGVLHCFTEDWEMAEQALALNFYVSFSGIITFNNAKALCEVAKQVPIDRLLIETDAPYLAPMPHRGRSNQPAWVRHVAEKMAQLRGMTLEEIATITTANYQRLFGAATT